MVNAVTVRSKHTPDHNGTWAKSDIEEEMKSLGIAVGESSDTDWIEFLFDHAFIFDIDASVIEIVNNFIKNDKLVEITINMVDDDLTLIKHLSAGNQ